ncbi:MAG: YolD-like family protein [Acholeplasmatales bacterium]|jgi:hypothetical protein|nr:YolD-like family protein [Acholeplasmataceae bacterium]MDY0115463.1 YolD-like family protein [Acholeplasmatales bacterium]MCK9234135.1 YolD-like family protein [Acholeplasmataceae bacterium]MCK9288894.1 YolD-like family protein [Acholeplasmataceae bacterium]MCK9427488.1 YolD-like family protein [Acholeplasmataceae bacterium]
MHNFDRGLIKWLPFDALTGFKEALIALKKKRLYLEKPLLSEDQYQTLNENIKIALKHDLKIELYYYSKGRINYLNAKITKIDYHLKKIKIANKVVDVSAVLTINTNLNVFSYQDYLRP